MTSRERAEAGASDGAGHLGAERDPGRAPLILVVDDDPTTRMVARASLGKAGLLSEEAEDGYAALALLDARVPDLILLDVTMPGIDGFETCVRIREHRSCEAVPILMVTGLDDMVSIQQAYDVGATDFITKPVNWPILEYRIRYLLRSQGQRHRKQHP